MQACDFHAQLWVNAVYVCRCRNKELAFFFSGRSGYVFHQHDGKNDTLIDEPYFSYDSPKMFQ